MDSQQLLLLAINVIGLFIKDMPSISGILRRKADDILCLDDILDLSGGSLSRHKVQNATSGPVKTDPDCVCAGNTC